MTGNFTHLQRIVCLHVLGYDNPFNLKVFTCHRGTGACRAASLYASQRKIRIEGWPHI